MSPGHLPCIFAGLMNRASENRKLKLKYTAARPCRRSRVVGGPFTGRAEPRVQSRRSRRSSRARWRSSWWRRGDEACTSPGRLARAEPNSASRAPFWWLDEPPHRLDDRPQFMVVLADSSLELREPGRQLSLARHPCPKPQEGAHHEDAHLDGSPTVEDGRGHDSAMLRECEREVFDVSSPLQDHKL